MYKNQVGHTLIELIIFIIILGFMAVGVLMSFDVAMHKAPDVRYATRAIELAQRRMDFILGQRDIKGFASYNDPCQNGSSSPLCTDPTGYTTSSSIANNWSGNTAFNVITVTVSGLGNASLTELVANY